MVSLPTISLLVKALRTGLVGTIIIALTSCSGGSSSSNALTNSQNTSPPNNNTANAQSIAALPAPGDQPNTVSANLQIDANGQQHTVYSNIDGRVIYATCLSQCNDTNRWTDVTLINTEIDAILGYAVPKLQIDLDGVLHVAVVVNQDGGVVFASQQTHYFQCQSDCVSVANWRGAIIHTHADGHLEEDLENTQWFNLSNQGYPKLAFIETPPGFGGDESLYVISCNQNCLSPQNWQTQPTAALNLASKKPATILPTDTGGVRVIFEYQVIASTRSELQYIECAINCDSTQSAWSMPVTIQALSNEAFDYNTYAVDLIAGDVPYLAMLSNIDGFVDVKVITCISECSQAGNWLSTSIIRNIDLPPNTTIAGRSIDINFDRGALDLALLAKQNAVSVPSILARVSCTTNCFEGPWSYEEMATTTPIVFENIGNCIFVATAISGPISLYPNAASGALVPHWACSGAPVEVTDADGNVYIDYNGDVRFFEIASMIQI